MRTSLSLAVAASLLFAGTTASADASDAAMHACAARCARVVSACALRYKSASESAARACAEKGEACVQSCTPRGAGSQDSASTARSTGAQQMIPEASAEDTGLLSNPEAAADRLAAAWQRVEQARVASADAEAAQVVADVLRALCSDRSGGDGSCMLKVAVLPSVPPVHLAPAPPDERWKLRVAAADKATAALGLVSVAKLGGTSADQGTGAAASGSGGVKKKKGCWTTETFHVSGGWGSNKMYIDASISNGFQDSAQNPSGTGNQLWLHNDDPDHEVYVGTPTPYALTIAPVSEIRLPYSGTPAPGEPSQMDVGVKWWTDDSGICGTHASVPPASTRGSSSSRPWPTKTVPASAPAAATPPPTPVGTLHQVQ